MKSVSWISERTKEAIPDTIAHAQLSPISLVNESDYEKILLLETEQASNHERERIYRNLHDDMGSKLLSLVYETENMAALFHMTFP